MTNSNETPDIALLNQLNTLASAGDKDKDPSQMNSEEMKQFSESIAQAADVVTNENADDHRDDDVSLMIKEKTGNRQVVDDQIDIQTKENEIIKAEAANSAATGDNGNKQAMPDKKEMAPKQLESAIKQEQFKSQFDIDKQSALDEGYTEDQAEQYAT